MIWLATILFFVVLTCDLFTDYNKWLKNRSVNHTKEAWVRILLLMPSIVSFIWIHPGSTFWASICVLLMEFFAYWLLFDGIYNRVRGFDWWWTGSIDPDDSNLDIILRNIGPLFHQIIKISGTIIFWTIYLLTYFKK